MTHQYPTKVTQKVTERFIVYVYKKHFLRALNLRFLYIYFLLFSVTPSPFEELYNKNNHLEGDGKGDAGQKVTLLRHLFGASLQRIALHTPQHRTAQDRCCII